MERRFHTLMLMHSHQCGGAEKHALLLMQGLCEAGHRVTFAGPRNSWLWEQAERHDLPRLPVALNGTCDPVSALRLAHFARREAVDLIHGHLTRSSLYAARAARLAGVPAVGSAHSTNSFKRFDRLDRIVAVSGAVKRFLMEKGLPPERIRIVHNGTPDPRPCEMTCRARVRASLGLRAGERAVGMLARFIPDKGQDLAVKALAKLNDPSARLFFIGKAEGDWYEKVRRLAEEFELGDRVAFLGHREDTYELLSAMDLLVAPSRREAMSLTLLEALSMGLPVAASDVGGNPEILRDGENGLLFPPDDLDGLARAMRAALTCPDLSRRLSENARRSYLERFSQERMTRDMTEVYRELAGHG